MTNRPSDPGEEDDSGEEIMPRPERPDEKRSRKRNNLGIEGAPPTPAEVKAEQEAQEARSPGEVEAELQARRTRLAELGFILIDPSKLEKGPPLSQEDHQSLLRFHRAPETMAEAEQIRLIRLIHRYDTWHQANREALIQAATEFGFGEGHRN